MATAEDEPSGMVVLRLYVPVDLNGAGTGGVPLPTVTYESRSGAPISLTQAAGTETMQKTLDSYRSQHGALPEEVTRHYPPAAPVPVPNNDPPPQGRISSGEGKFNNPGQHLRPRPLLHVTRQSRGLSTGTDLPVGHAADGQRSGPPAV